MLDITSAVSIDFYSLDTPFYNATATDKELLKIGPKLQNYLAEVFAKESKLDEPTNKYVSPFSAYERKDKRQSKKVRASANKVNKHKQSNSVSSETITGIKNIRNRNITANSNKILSEINKHEESSSNASTKLNHKGRKLLVWD